MGESLNGFEGKTVLRNIQTKSGERVAAGVAVVACGSEPNLDIRPQHALFRSPRFARDRISRDGRERNLCGRRPRLLSRPADGRDAPSDALGKRARTRLGRGREHDWQKAQRYEQIPYFWTEMFDLKLDFVGDFSMQPTRVDLTGTHAKKKFTAFT